MCPNSQISDTQNTVAGLLEQEIKEQVSYTKKILQRINGVSDVIDENRVDIHVLLQDTEYMSIPGIQFVSGNAHHELEHMESQLVDKHVITLTQQRDAASSVVYVDRGSVINFVYEDILEK